MENQTSLEKVLMAINESNSLLKLLLNATNTNTEILIGRQEDISVGRGASGIKGDIDNIKDNTHISEDSKSHRYLTHEDLIKKLGKEIDEKFDSRISVVDKSKIWKNIILGVGIAVTALFTVLNYINSISTKIPPLVQ